MGRGRTIDTGGQYGSWTVIRELEDRAADGHRKFLCLCECGQENEIHSGNLQSLRRRNAICAHPGGLPAARMIGKRVGDLMIKSYAFTDKHGHANWNCLCSCGTECVVATGPLRKGQKSCGCKQGSAPSIEIGKEYGWLTATGWAESKADGRRVANAKCRCGSERLVLASLLATGRTVSCGCAIKGNMAPVRKDHIRIENASNYARRKRGGVGDYTKDDIARLFVRQRGHCAICKTKTPMAEMTRDHVVPIKRGGLNLLSNLQLLCRRCNCSKGAKDPIAYMRERGLLL